MLTANLMIIGDISYQFSCDAIKGKINKSYEILTQPENDGLY